MKVNVSDPYEEIDSNISRLHKSLIKSFKVKSKVDYSDMKILLDKASELIGLLEDLIEVNTHVPKPILRKSVKDNLSDISL